MYSDEWFLIQNQVSNFYKKYGSVVWFRGHSKADTFKLNSGLFRDSSESLENILERESTLYTEFHNMGHMDHLQSGWNLLYIMQHHGVQTRLLDWSESFATALYFAYIGWVPEEEDACIWMLAPYKLNKIFSEHKNERLITFTDNQSYNRPIYKRESIHKKSIALHPVQNNKRIIAQRGVFILQGDSLKPIDEELDGVLLEEGYLIKIILTKDLYNSVKNFLRLSGVTHYTLFPDLDGLAKLINVPEEKRNF